VRIIVTGSLAYDYIMNFPGKFSDHILPDKVHMLTVSFLVDSMKKMRGGTAGNIAYTLAMLGAKTAVVSAAGQDFNEYRDFMHGKGIDTRGIKLVLYPGAVGHAKEVTLASLGLEKGDWVIISPTDPESMARHTAECKKAGVSYIFDPGKQVPRLDKAQILAGLDGCAAFVGNDYEFGMMAKATGLTEQQLFDMSPMTVMTRGDQGSRILVKGQPVIEIPIAKPTAVVDPTGAGDAYLGALAFGFARKLPHQVTGRIAALAATYAIELKGCQEHFFSVDDFARRYQEAFGEKLAL
jgi:adenosine kinase